MNNQKLKNGFNLRENLLICIAESTATAKTFEVVIQESGLDMEIIALISEYYKDDISEMEKLKAKVWCRK